MPTQLTETDASLLSWLHALPVETFACPFEEKPLELGMSRFEKPILEAQWSSAILSMPIKPRQLFPYSAVPVGCARNAEILSRSLSSKHDEFSLGATPSEVSEVNKRSVLSQVIEEDKMTDSMRDSALFREYKKNKAKIREKLEEREKKRDDLVNQFKCKFFSFLERISGILLIRVSQRRVWLKAASKPKVKQVRQVSIKRAQWSVSRLLQLFMAQRALHRHIQIRSIKGHIVSSQKGLLKQKVSKVLPNRRSAIGQTTKAKDSIHSK